MCVMIQDMRVPKLHHTSPYFAPYSFLTSQPQPNPPLPCVATAYLGAPPKPGSDDSVAAAAAAAASAATAKALQENNPPPLPPRAEDGGAPPPPPGPPQTPPPRPLLLMTRSQRTCTSAPGPVAWYTLQRRMGSAQSTTSRRRKYRQRQCRNPQH